ncbi:MAG: squalene--hopene cyclase [Planctomycetes bacterium]|nr:squalene--hopene cyclase [Planctomycetota bacterium]
MSDRCCLDRLERGFLQVRDALLQARTADGHWTGQLSTSALSTATAVMAFHVVLRSSGCSPVPSGLSPERLSRLIDGGLRWLANHQNKDGGWGDTPQSFSNISTTMLAFAVLAAAGRGSYNEACRKAERYIDQAGGVAAIIRRYGKDRTFSAPILTHCALAGLVDWDQVVPLPFELARLPHRFYKTVRLPVVSYALPALIAIGQVRYFHRKPRNPVVRLVRQWSIEATLERLQRIQPSSGGFLEAAPLTSFVTMSLAAMGRADHPVVRRGLEFLCRSVRSDGSWPIDTNLATWVTTLSINALGDQLPVAGRPALRDWLLRQQYRQVHPYTNAAPGGWAWTDLPGGVPDADDTPGAILALLHLSSGLSRDDPNRAAIDEATGAGVRWLLRLQNRDGGWPTFCRGWGALPFDRSAPDITAHVLRALSAWRRHAIAGGRSGNRRNRQPADRKSLRRVERAVRDGFAYLAACQRGDGAWIPLWFGNQHAPDEENPTYGTARVLAAYRDVGRLKDESAQRGLRWLAAAQRTDGGWGGAPGVPASIEETALATEALLAEPGQQSAAWAGLNWLLDRIEAERYTETAPIGFYFAKLWYSEALYPLIFTVAALRRARAKFGLREASPSPIRQQNRSDRARTADAAVENTSRSTS